MWFDYQLELDPPRAGKPELRFPSGFAMRNARRWFQIIGSLVAINLVCAPESRLHAQGAPPADRPVEPADIAATIFHSLGLDPETTLPGPAGRPFPLVDFGHREIHELF